MPVTKNTQERRA